MLKFRIDQAAFDGLNEVEQTFYKQGEDGYKLEVEGAVDKTKVDEFRASNIDLMKKQEQYNGIDLDEVRELQANKRKLLDAEFINKKDFDGLVESRTNTMRSDYEAKIATLTDSVANANTNFNSVVSKYEIEGAANQAFSRHKISPDAYETVMAHVKSKFTIDNGAVIAKDGDSIVTGIDGNLSVDEFVSNMPEAFKVQSSGGRPKGGDGQGVNNQKSSNQKITSGLSKLM